MDTTTATARVAEAVRKAAADRGVSQLALSNATGIPRVTLIRKLRGQSPFTVPELAAIADEFGMDATEFWAVA